MRLLSPALLLLSSSAFAQITLVTAEHAPVIGTGFIVNTGAYMAPGSGGASQLWDFSALAATGSDEIQFVDPAATPNGADFTLATIAMVDNDGNYSYFQSDANGFILVGNDDGAITFPLTDGAQYWPFPCEHEDTWSDILAGTIVIAGQNVTRAGTVEGHADGYGDLVMPWGTVYGVLRVSLHEEFQDATPLGTVVHDVMTHRFFTRFLPFPVLQITDASTTVNGSTTTAQTTQWVDSAVVALEENGAWTTHEVVVFPNPATDEINIAFDGHGNAVIEVMDLLGRTVLAKYGTDAGVGARRCDLDVRSLSPGTYAVSVMAANGDRGTARLVIR